MNNNTPWWYMYRKQRYKKRNYLTIEMIIRKSFRETLKEYLDTTSIGGIREMRDPAAPKLERILWMGIFCIALSSVCMFLYSTWINTFTSPLIVTSESFTYPIKDIDFPAVALCNINRISNKALVAYVNSVSGHLGRRNFTTFFLENYFRSMGRLIDFRYEENIERIANLLPLEDLNVNVIETMQKLAPSCEEMLIKCKWAGKDVNCANLFSTRRTGFGHCCAFNYVLKLNSADSPSSTGIIAPVKKQVVPGENNGLMVVADPLIEDYAYRLNSRNGFQVLIYDSLQYPDLSGSRILYRVAQPDQAEFLQIESYKQYATSEVRKYPHRTRKCLFQDELKTIFRNLYSYSACLLRCRIETVRSLCKCIPYFYPSGIYKDERICTLKNLRCLNKYKAKLLYLFPMDTENTSGLETELADSLFCPNCLPDCELTQHFTRNYKVSLSKITSTGFDSNFLVGVNVTNKCVLYVYRPTTVGVLHRLDVVAYWFEILSNIGGFAGMVMGIGCFTFAEILYYIIIRFVRSLYYNFRKFH